MLLRSCPAQMTYLAVQQQLPPDAEGTFAYDFRVPHDFAHQEVQLQLVIVYNVGNRYFKSEFFNKKLSFVQTSIAGNFSTSDIFRVIFLALGAAFIGFLIATNVAENEGKSIWEIIGSQQSTKAVQGREAGDFGASHDHIAKSQNTRGATPKSAAKKQ